ncbi:MAG: histidine kinase [Chitinophagaceae bacterium]|nr:histidine kinase [Chitinophagaceae bacterium]
MNLRLLYIILLACCCSRLSPLAAQTASPVADSLLRLMSTSRADTHRALLLLELANEVSYYDSKKALTYVDEGLKLCNQLQYPNGTCRLLYIGGVIHLDLSDYERSKQMLDSAEQIATALRQTDMLGKINNGRGNWHFLQSDMYNASYYYSRSVENFQQIHDTAREIRAYQNLIATLGEIKNYDRAIALSLELLDKLIMLKDTMQIGYAYNHLIVNYLGNDNLTEAAKYVPLLDDISSKTKDLGLASDSYTVIGDYYLKKQQYDSAISFFNKAMRIALRENFQPAIINLSLGVAYLKKNNLNQAFQNLSEALRLSRESNSRDVYYRACLPLSEYYSKTNDPAKAYFYLQEYTKLNDSILVAETRQYTSYLAALNETQKKEKAIADLQLSNAAHELTVAKRTRIIFIGGTLALASFVIIGLLYRNSLQRNIIAEKDRRMQAEQIRFLEQQQQVVSLQSMINGQETERTRIAKDLHDGLGGLFSTVKMHFSTLQHQQPQLKADALFARSYEMINSASEEVRRIAHNMMPEVLIKLGLIQAIQDLAGSISAGKLLQVSVQAYGMDKRLNASTEIMLFRIIQELINNIIKHADATEAIIQFNREGNRLSVTVEDNGRGFSLQEGDDKTHAGLSSVQSRVNYLNGTMSIDSQREVGTTVMMDFLINE